MRSNYERKDTVVVLDNLPRRGKMINWIKICKEHNKIYFVDNNKKDYMEAYEYIGGKNSRIKIKYKDDIYTIGTGNLCSNRIGAIIGNISLKHKYNVGDVVECKYNKVKILKKIYVVASKITKKNIRGYKIECMDCHSIREISEADLVHDGIGCNECHDFISFPEKAFTNILIQLGIKYKRQQKFKWAYYNKSDNNKLNGKKKYDFNFIVNNEEILTETNGMQHYKKSFETIGGRSVEEEIENDRIKKELAINNGIKEENYIVIDCRYSDIDFIKNNILNNKKLNSLFDLSKIDWNEVNIYATKNFVIEVCKYYEQVKDVQTVANYFNLDRSTITKYLKRGIKLKICTYNPQKEKQLSYAKMKEATSKKVLCLDNLARFKSTKDCERRSLEVFGIQLNHSAIASVCSEKRGRHHNLHFVYEDDFKDDISKIKSKTKDEIKDLIERVGRGKLLMCTDDERVFGSLLQCSKKSQEIYGVKMTSASIGKVCRGERKSYKGHHYKYI